jgi:hypothetical protein
VEDPLCSGYLDEVGAGRWPSAWRTSQLKADMLPYPPGAKFEIRAEASRRAQSLRLCSSGASTPSPGDAHRDWFLGPHTAGTPSSDGLRAEVRFRLRDVASPEQDRPAFPVWGDPVTLVPGPRPSEERRNVGC